MRSKNPTTFSNAYLNRFKHQKDEKPLQGHSPYIGKSSIFLNSDVTLQANGLKAVFDAPSIARIIDVFKAIDGASDSPQSHTQPRAKKGISAILAIVQHEMYYK